MCSACSSIPKTYFHLKNIRILDSRSRDIFHIICMITAYIFVPNKPCTITNESLFNHLGSC